MRIRSALLVTGLAMAAALGGAGTASADPSQGELVPVVCDNGHTYLVAVNGNGLWTPGHDVDSTTMLIPTAFGEFHGVVTDSEGNIIEEFTDPAAAKGRASRPRATTTSCTFTITETFLDPELGLLTFTGTGSVTGFVTPVR
jgi:hypothetical protein